MLFVMINAHSKFICAHFMNSDTTTLKTLSIIFTWFSDRGFPSTLVSDNCPQFTAKEFTDKMTKWGIKHMLTPPYHPVSNGLAERAVGLVKDRLKKMNCSAAQIQLHVGLKFICRVHGLTPH